MKYTKQQDKDFARKLLLLEISRLVAESINY